jgi:sugar/nucleoside kinase (ribokinase family)
MSSRAFDVIVPGSLHLDIVVYAPSLPRLDETTMGARWAMPCGGKGGNQAVMAARAGPTDVGAIDRPRGHLGRQSRRRRDTQWHHRER